MHTHFRPATADDSRFLGWAMFMAARGHLPRGWFDIVLRRPVEFGVAFCARLANAEAKSWWHHAFFTVAEVDGRPAAAACAFADSAPYMASRAAMAEACDRMGIGAAERLELRPRGQFMMSATSGEDDCWTIENVATWPEFRGRGVARALIARMLNDMRKEGPKRAQISVLIGNAPAEKAYRACGFEFAEDKTAPDFEAAMGVAGIRRLARDL
ncbi:MAG TPA: GNAT family N-acetyltransferase [Rhizomicrobium sp.]|jgi:GNAT superfamily N-acetyltransferase|nr:GNAT family N-acetyltransferase [Rhizomicrobium sp.]